MRDKESPWDVTRAFPVAYENWQYEVRNGDTLLGFIDWCNDPRLMDKTRRKLAAIEMDKQP